VHAQFLKKIMNSVKQTAQNRAENKTNQATNKALDKADSAVFIGNGSNASSTSDKASTN
jgi:hypothetical protein